MWTTSITFAKSTEAHVGCEIHGTPAERGYENGDLNRIKAWAKEAGVLCEAIDLSKACGVERSGNVLVLRGALKAILTRSSHRLSDLVEEFVQRVHPRCDNKMVNFRKVTSKKARRTAEIGPEYCESTIAPAEIGSRVEPGQILSGIVLPFRELPYSECVLQGLTQVVGDRAKGLRAEVNYYDRVHECGIGFHGDSERPDVLGAVLGHSKELHWQAFQGAMPVGERVIVTLNSGDMYVMDEDACGYAWKKDMMSRTRVHYRHAAGPIGGNQYTPSNDVIRHRYELKKKRKTKRSADAVDVQEVYACHDALSEAIEEFKAAEKQLENVAKAASTTLKDTLKRLRGQEEPLKKKVKGSCLKTKRSADVVDVQEEPLKKKVKGSCL